MGCANEQSALTGMADGAPLNASLRGAQGSLPPPPPPPPPPPAPAPRPLRHVSGEPSARARERSHMCQVRLRVYSC
jgi:hypothetical protein